MVKVELVYIPASKNAMHFYLSVAPMSTVADVLHQSGLLQSYPEINTLPVGIFSKVVSLTTVVKSGDRIEIYRPLVFDPKENRRQRARQNKG